MVQECACQPAACKNISPISLERTCPQLQWVTLHRMVKRSRRTDILLGQWRTSRSFWISYCQKNHRCSMYEIEPKIAQPLNACLMRAARDPVMYDGVCCSYVPPYAPCWLRFHCALAIFQRSHFSFASSFSIIWNSDCNAVSRFRLCHGVHAAMGQEAW